MVKVSVDQKGDSITRLRITGHANSGPHGQDLVCAGVSSIAVGALNAIDLLENKRCTFKMSSGLIEIHVIESTERLQNLLQMLVIQLSTMEESYQKHIRIIKQEV